MALIPDGQTQRVALMVGLLALGGLYAFNEWVHTPRVQEIESLEARVSQLEDQNRRAQLIAARGEEDLEERLAAYQRHVHRLEELIPAGEEVPALLRSVALEAQRAGVVMDGVRPEPSRPGEFYTEESYQLTVVGDYHDVGRFLTAIASLPRIVTPVELEMERTAGAAARAEMEAPVRVRFRIKTYVLPGDRVPAELPDLPGGEAP